MISKLEISITSIEQLHATVSASTKHKQLDVSLSRFPPQRFSSLEKTTSKHRPHLGLAPAPGPQGPGLSQKRSGLLLSRLGNSPTAALSVLRPTRVCWAGTNQPHKHYSRFFAVALRTRHFVSLRRRGQCNSIPCYGLVRSRLWFHQWLWQRSCRNHTEYYWASLIKSDSVWVSMPRLCKQVAKTAEEKPT